MHKFQIKGRTFKNEKAAFQYATKLLNNNRGSYDNDEEDEETSDGMPGIGVYKLYAVVKATESPVNVEYTHKDKKKHKK